MASIHLQGILVDSVGEIDVGGVITFTHLTTTGETIASTQTELIIPPDGAYSIDVEYGQIRIDYTTRNTERFVANVIVNSASTATSLPELLSATTPVAKPIIIQMQGLVADATAAEAGAVAAEATLLAEKLTTVQLIALSNTFAVGSVIDTLGYTSNGDGGSSSWVQNGVTGQTVSQSPAQLGDGLLNDASGNQWSVVTDGTINVKTLGAVGDISTDDTAAIQASYNYAKNNAQDLFIAGGIYKCTSTLIFDGAGVNTRGVGSHSISQTVLLIDHNSGPGVHISEGRQTLSYLRVKGGNDRQIAAASIADCGILIEPADTVGNLMSQVGIDWVLCDDHNGSGIVANQITGLTMEQTVVADCRRHAFVFGNSDESTRTNKDNYTGMVFASECRFTADNYSVLIGGPGDVAQGASAFRIHMRSIDDGGGPAAYSAPISSYGPAGWWVRGQNVIIENTAMHPGDSGGEALIVSGKNVEVGITNRLLGLASSDYGIRVLNWTANQTRDLTIDRPYIIGTKPAVALVALDKSTTAPAAAVDANTVSVNSSQQLNGTTLEPVDRLLVSEYTDRQKKRINSELAIKILSTPVDNQFIAVASGVLDVSQSSVQVTGEGGVADSIDTITFDGGTPSDGMELKINAGSSSQNITINNNTGNIRCGSNRILLSNADLMVLVYKSSISTWLMQSFQNN